MPTLTTADNVTLHYTDTGGTGRPLVLVHGWPLSGEAFAGNIPTFVDAGYRVVTYDRRGFGRSGKPSGDVDYDILADDLAAVVSHLALRGAVLLGFSMGGGEVARYFSRHSSEPIAGAIFSGSIAPALCVTDDNPDGAMPIDGFQGLAEQCAADHPGFVDQFVTNFYSSADGGLQVDEETRQAAVAIGRRSDPRTAVQTILLWATDLRADCRAIKVPTLAIHGDGDLNVPIDASSRRLPDYVDGAELVVIEGGPHGSNVSHKQQWEGAILDFLGRL